MGVSTSEIQRTGKARRRRMRRARKSGVQETLRWRGCQAAAKNKNKMKTIFFLSKTTLREREKEREIKNKRHTERVM